MSFNKKYIVFNVEEEDIQIGIPVGYQIDYSADVYFREIRSSISTFNYEDPQQVNKIYYSTDGGVTWSIYSFGSTGIVFNDPFQLRIEANLIDAGYILIETDGTLKKIRSDLYSLIGSSNIGGNITGIDIATSNDCFMLQDDSIMIANYDNTNNIVRKKLPLMSDRTLGLVVDGPRKSFWQINPDSVYLRNFYGEKIFSILIPEIEIDMSSSSSVSSET